MTWSEVAVVVVVVLLLVLWRVWVRANRLDRLHRKVESSRAALDTQLVRRASVCAEIAACGALDPVSSVLVSEAAWTALEVGEDEPAGGLEATKAGAARRDMAESELSRTVRAVLEDREEVAAMAAAPGVAGELLEALAAAWYRVELSRRFHNEAVAQTHRVRRKTLVRLLGLQGRAPMPRSVEIDDGWPDGLPRPGEST